MSDDDLSLSEKRVFDEHRDAETLVVATGLGVASVSVSGGIVGEFGLDEQCVAQDVAAGGGLVAVATDEDVLVSDGEGYVETGFGPASAVGFHEEALVAASEAESELGRLLEPRASPTEWLMVADVDAPVRAIDGPFVAAADGLYRVTADSVTDVGLTDVRDVVAAGTPRAATGDGLYRLGNGWQREREGAFDAVADDGTGHALALDADGVVLERTTADDPGVWSSVTLPENPVDVAVGETGYAVSADGVVMADDGEGWRSRAVGLGEVASMTVVR